MAAQFLLTLLFIMLPEIYFPAETFTTFVTLEGKVVCVCPPVIYHGAVIDKHLLADITLNILLPRVLLEMTLEGALQTKPHVTQMAFKWLELRMPGHVVPHVTRIAEPLTAHLAGVWAPVLVNPHVFTKVSPTHNGGTTLLALIRLTLRVKLRKVLLQLNVSLKLFSAYVASFI